MIAPNTGESPDEVFFYCLFCEKVSTFRREHYDRFEGHMKSVHKVVTNLETATKVNFLNKENKNIIVDQAKAVAKKGDTFSCGLCSDSIEFVLGETKSFKSHMEISHNIYFEIGTFLALNFYILNYKSAAQSNSKDLGNAIIPIPQNVNLEGCIVDQMHEKTSKEKLELQYAEDTPESTDKDNLEIEDKYNTDLTDEANQPSKLQKRKRNKQTIVKRFDYNSIILSKGGTFDNKYNQYKCMYCSFVAMKGPQKTTTKSNTNNCFLKYQIRTHMRKLHYVCTVCEVKLSSGKELNVHYDTDHKTDGKKVKCSIGGCTSQLTFTAMITHVQAAHNGDVFLCNLSVMNLSNNETETCGKKYPYLSSLDRHKEQPHIKQTKKLRPKVTCNFCGLLLKSLSLTSHIRLVHGEKYFCSSCSFSTKYTSYLKVHEQGHQETFKCPTCNFSSSIHKNLKNHIKAQHEIGEIYLCSFCEYKTAYFQRLRDHEETHGEYNFKCPNCDYKGKSKNSLRNHMKQHKDPKFHCQQCDYKTYDAGNFSAHKITKHGTVALKCEQCSYSTKVNRQLRRHNQNSHGIMLPKKKPGVRKTAFLPDSVNDGQV